MKPLLTALLSSSLLAFVSGKSVTQDSFPASKGTHQCEYNGQTYSLGDSLPTQRLCLSCNCTQDFVEPNDYHCDVIQCPQTNHLELGCIPHYSDTECCPVDWDCESVKALVGKCDKRYQKHYAIKGCTPVFEEESECPLRFLCPPVEENNGNKTEGCEFRGRLHREGETIDTGNPCQICSCAGGPDIRCISVECPSVFGPRPNDSCYEVFESGRCCSVRTDCAPPDPQQQVAEVVCEHGGRTYHLGQKIYPDEEPCLVCTCTEEWRGLLNSSSCSVHDCLLERNRKQLGEGCLPIYHEGTCCPIEFFCGSEEEGFQSRTVSTANTTDIESGNACSFQGVHYKLGEVLDINHPTHCVTCACVLPPDFTCVHKKCPGPPGGDYENCQPTYVPGDCCPSYNCLAAAPTPAPLCSPVKCPDGCPEVTVHNSCPFCQCQGRLCSPPNCPPGCPLNHTSGCPTCQCPDVEHLPCSPVKCPGHCYEGTNNRGCPICICGPLCSPPKCAAGCRLQRDVAPGECPRCECSSLDGMQCSPVKCLPTCHESVGESGCPSCLCEPLCSPPKCDPSCRLSSVSPGSCPECLCGDQRAAAPLCAPVKCGPLCHEVFESDGCPGCVCDPLCSPPKCEVGCRLEHDPSTGPCPGCVCDSQKEVCPRITCGAMCQQHIGSDGCSTCSCDPLCSPPKCETGCHLEYDRSAGPCPACVCTDFKGAVTGIMCSPPKCDPGCQIDYNSKPCPSCRCAGDNAGAVTGIMCSPPKCDPGCQIDYNSKPCPSCQCAGDNNPEILQCSPVKCDSHCHQVIGMDGCASCSCPQCTVPVCGPGCRIDHNAEPCPSCVCDRFQRRYATLYQVNAFSDPLCARRSCGPGCERAPGTAADRCPGCLCRGRMGEKLNCAAMQCDLPCRFEKFSPYGCPSCICHPIPCPALDCKPGSHPHKLPEERCQRCVPQVS